MGNFQGKEGGYKLRVCKQQYDASYVHVLKKNAVKQLIPLGQSLNSNFKMLQEAMENQNITCFFPQYPFWPHVFCALSLIVKHLEGL